MPRIPRRATPRRGSICGASRMAKRTSIGIRRRGWVNRPMTSQSRQPRGAKLARRLRRRLRAVRATLAPGCARMARPFSPALQSQSRCKMRSTPEKRYRLFASTCLSILLVAGLAHPRCLAQESPARTVRLAPAGSVSSWPASAKRFALVIGVDQYADTQITTLGGAANDAHALASALVRYAGFEKENVLLLTSTQPAERQPTRG